MGGLPRVGRTNRVVEARYAAESGADGRPWKELGTAAAPAQSTATTSSSAARELILQGWGARPPRDGQDVSMIALYSPAPRITNPKSPMTS